MPITHVASRGGASIAAAGTSEALALTTPEAVAVGDVLVLAVACENTGASGAAPGLAVTDPRGNTWTSLGSALNDPGLASEGAYVQLFAALTLTAYQAGDALTLTAATGPGRTAWAVNEYAGVRKTVAAGPTTGTGATSVVALGVTPPAAGQLVLTALAAENNVIPTGDVDTLNGPWVTAAARISDSGTWSTSIALIAQHKIVTASGAQTWNPGLGASVDWAAVAVALTAAAFAVDATYDATLSRVRLAITDIDPAATSVRVQRSTDGSTWSTVRGSGELAATPAAQTVYDDEFIPGATNTYRVQALTAAGAVMATATATIAPAPTGVWLKNVTRPYLNRVVRVHQYSDITRPARGGVLEVLGRRDPVAVTDVRGSRRFDLVLRADTRAEVEALELALSFGDTVFLQPPAGSPVPGPLHAFVGDVTTDKGGEHQLELRFLTLPLTEVEAPAASIAGSAITWTGVTGAYATWAALVAARPSWVALLESVSDPGDEVVG